MPKVTKNLYLDEEAVERAEKYGSRHGISLSQLVSDFLRGLPVEGESRGPGAFTPAVRRLVGAAKGVSEDDYRRYLEERHL